MSVPSGLRGQSDAEFLHTAKVIDETVCRFCMKMPKSMMFLKSQRLAHLAMDAYYNVMAANSVYPKNAHEVQIRRDYIVTARGKYYFIGAELEVLNDIIGIDPKKMQNIAGLIHTELKLLKALMESDARRFSSLK